MGTSNLSPSAGGELEAAGRTWQDASRMRYLPRCLDSTPRRVEEGRFESLRPHGDNNSSGEEPTKLSSLTQKLVLFESKMQQKRAGGVKGSGYTLGSAGTQNNKIFRFHLNNRDQHSACTENAYRPALDWQ